jgi:alanine-synthesizing transaminase
MDKRRNGDDVIDLGMGNPMDPTPEAVIEKRVEVESFPPSSWPAS